VSCRVVSFAQSLVEVQGVFLIPKLNHDSHVRACVLQSFVALPVQCRDRFIFMLFFVSFSASFFSFFLESKMELKWFPNQQKTVTFPALFLVSFFDCFLIVVGRPGPSK